MNALALASAALALLGPASTNDVRALKLALADERSAIALYEAALRTFGERTPFSNLVRAERTHAALVEATMERLGVPVPKDPHPEAEAPATWEQALEEGIRAERENVALYDRLLRMDLSPEVRQTLERLLAASRDRHLPALERALSRRAAAPWPPDGPGRGSGGFRWRHGRGRAGR